MSRIELLDLVFVDVETSGLDPAKHDLLEVAAVRVNPFFEVGIRYWSKVIPPDGWLERADSKALKVCGYEESAWADAAPLSTALDRLSTVLDGAVVCGHNVQFDLAFLRSGYELAGLPFPAVDYHVIDTSALTWLLCAAGQAKALSLDAACAALGIERPSPHRALADAYACLEVAKRMRAREATAARFMDSLRAMGGSWRPVGA